MPISASPNSTRPRSSRRFTIARAKNSTCLMLVGTAAILKHHLSAKRACAIGIPGRCWMRSPDAADLERRRKHAIAIDAQHAHHALADRPEQRDCFGKFLIDAAETLGAQMKPRPPRTQPVARPKPVRRLFRCDRPPGDGPPLSVVRRFRLMLGDFC